MRISLIVNSSSELEAQILQSSYPASSSILRAWRVEMGNISAVYANTRRAISSGKQFFVKYTNGVWYTGLEYVVKYPPVKCIVKDRLWHMRETLPIHYQATVPSYEPSYPLGGMSNFLAQKCTCCTAAATDISCACTVNGAVKSLRTSGAEFPTGLPCAARTIRFALVAMRTLMINGQQYHRFNELCFNCQGRGLLQLVP